MAVPGGRTIWTDAGSWPLQPLLPVKVQLPDGIVGGVVCVLPELLLIPPPEVHGRIVGLEDVSVDEDPCGALPGEDMPYLGTRVRIGGRQGQIVALDVARRSVSVRLDSGSTVDVDADECR